MLAGIVSRSALAVALCIAGAVPAIAADEDNDIIVTGKSLEETLPQELATYGHDVENVSDKAIRNSGAVDVARALAEVPGLYIRSSAGPFSYVDVSLQGSRTADTLWTMDGIRLNNRLYSGTSPNDTLPASMIERIEVLKGGESLFYGTAATAGIINVVTRGFTDDFNGQLNGNVDSFGGYSADGYIRGGSGGHRFVAYASRNQGKGYQQYSVLQPSATDNKRGYELWTVGLKYQTDLAPDLTLNAQYQHTEGKLDNLSVTRVRESRNDRNEEIASVRLDYTGSDTVQFFLKGYFHDWKTAYVQIRNTVPVGGAPIIVYPPGTFWGYQDYGLNAVMKLHLHPGLEYLLGYDYQTFNGRDDVLLIAPTNEKVHAGIFQVRTTDELSENAKFAAGLRHTKTGGSEKTIWNVGGRVDISDALYVEANGGTSFLLPDASQLYGNDPCCEIGNPNLKPEQSLNINASAGGTVDLGGGGLSWKATYFHRRITDLIDYDYDNPAFPEGTYTNVTNKVITDGAEVQLSAALANGFSASASYTHAFIRNQGSSVQRDRNPKDYAKGSLSYAPDDLPFGANIALSWVGDVARSATGFGRPDYGNYVLVDFGAHAYLDESSRRHRVGVNVDNVFDQDYATRGYLSAVSDASVISGSNARFLYYERGQPRTLRVSYGVSF